jgi:hypothetical protein
MFAWTPQKISNGLTLRIESLGSSCTVRDILENNDLSVSVTYEVPQLIDFFAPQNPAAPDPACIDHLKDLTTWALTSKNLTQRFDYRNCRNAANVLASISTPLLQRLLYPNSPLVDDLRAFLGTPYSDEDVFCGHFQRMLEAAARATHGEIMRAFPRDFFDTVIKRLRHIAFRTLIVHLISDVPEIFSGEDPPAGMTLVGLLRRLTGHAAEMAAHGHGKPVPPTPPTMTTDHEAGRYPRLYTDVTERSRPRHARHPGDPPLGATVKRGKTVAEYDEDVYGALVIFGELSTEDQTIITQFCDPIIVENLLKIGRNAHSNSVAFPAVYGWVAAILHSVQPVPQEVQYVVGQWFPDIIPPPVRFVAMFQVWPGRLVRHAIPYFFTEPPISDTFNEAFLDFVQSVPADQLRSFLEDEDNLVLRRIVVAVPFPPENEPNITFLNGHVVKLALFIADPDRNKVRTPFMSGELWKAFLIYKLDYWRLLERGQSVT